MEGSVSRYLLAEYLEHLKNVAKILTDGLAVISPGPPL